jgi:hypothetical protein
MLKAGNFVQEGVLEVQKHGTSIYSALVRAFWLHHSMADGIMV